MINNITTLGIPIINTSQVIKTESKQIKAQCVPYFFTVNKNTKKTIESASKHLQNKNKIVKK